MNLKSHVTFSKQQRHGIFLLLVILALLQVIYFYVRYGSEEIHVNRDDLLALETQVDSLKQMELARRQPRLYPVNPNYINDYRGALFGMNTEEIDRLLAFRKAGKWINSVAQFQIVTKISDSLLESMKPYLKFPDWLKESKKSFSSFNRKKTYAEKTDLNSATAQQLQHVSGVGPVLSERIIKFRNGMTQ